MNDDNREFVELKQQFIDYRERQMEANVDIKARLASIDASLSTLAPIITAHAERFKTIEVTCAMQNKTTSGRLDRVEKTGLGALVTVTGLFLTGVWAHVFPLKV